jgi:gamma-glutamylaminecyclotransferase
MSVLLFVYGTLKEGFPNHHLNVGRRLPGEFRTGKPLQLFVVKLPGEERAPWLVDGTGSGHQVRGQVFEVEDEALASMDEFEGVGQPTGYLRLELELERTDQEGNPRAFAYMKQEQQLQHCLSIEGPFEEYTSKLAVGYWIAAA